jgi:8-oxo-dGTP pyrophosphatase MutT (NUDIX family)
MYTIQVNKTYNDTKIHGRAPSRKQNIFINTFNRDMQLAKESLLNIIKPNGSYEDGQYSEAYLSGKKDDIENFVNKLNDPEYDVYSWDNIYNDLWNKNIDTNKYLKYAPKSGIIVTDGIRKISVKSYNNNMYNNPRGGLDKDETPIDGALREFTEETTLYIPEDYLHRLIPKCNKWYYNINVIGEDYDRLLKEYSNKVENTISDNVTAQCKDWIFTLNLSPIEYNLFIRKFNSDNFNKLASYEISGIKLEDSDTINGGLYHKNQKKSRKVRSRKVIRNISKKSK